MQPRAHGQDGVGLGRHGVGRGAADDADGAGVAGMVPQKRPAPGDGLDQRQVVALDERGELVGGPGVDDAAAGDHQRPLGVAQHLGRRHQLLGVGPGTALDVDRGFEEALGIIVALGLGLLRQADEGGAAIGGIEHHGHRLGQRGDQLLGPVDAVPIAAHRPERIVDRHRRIGEVLDLLEHWIGNPAGEGVAGKDEDGQPVGMGHRGRRHHVGRARAHRAGRNHDLAPPLGLGEGDGGERHRLLVLAAPGGQPIAHLVERLAEAGDVAVAEDREDTRKQGRLGAVDNGALRDEILHQGLGHGQAYGLHLVPPCRLGPS